MKNSNIYLRLKDRIVYQLGGVVPYQREMVFGIGLSKTATTSLYEALKILGYNAIDMPQIARVLPSKHIQLQWAWWASKYDAFTDLSVAVCFKELAALFPNAKFIYTVRDRDRWLDSCRRHFTDQLTQTRIQQNNQWMIDLCNAFYGSHVYSMESFNAAYEEHDSQVRKYFTNRDLLICDFTKKPNWVDICSYLGRPVPDEPFPHANIGNER